MRHKSLILLGLFLCICGWMLWARLPATQAVTTSEPSASEPSNIAQTSPQPTPLPPMPTPAMTRQVEEDWPTYTAPYWGVSFRYPPGWSVTGADEIIIIGRAVGSPLYISSTEENAGTITLILERYTLSQGVSLAEWLAVYNEYAGKMSMMGFQPIQLSTIPAAYLPAGVTQGVLSIGERRVNPPRSVWLEREGFVYSIHSTYNRPEDMALIFAIVSSLAFDPDVEATLRASGGFRGDDETLRQELAKIHAEAAERCDAACEYRAKVMEFERWKALPAPERPLVQPIRLPATEERDSWPTYTQPLLGISFRYPPELEVLDPFVEKELDESSVFDEAITVMGEEVMKIELFPYTVSDDVPLNNWEAIQDQLNRARNPLHQFQYRLIVPIEWSYMAQHVDDMVHTQDQAPYYRVETFWLSKDGVVFRVTSSYPPMASTVAAMVSTIEFDTEQLEKLRSLGLFVGDERTMVKELGDEWANPKPTVDPLATPTPIPTPTPWPTSTPTPIIRHTVTPSAFESPLVNGLKHYQGHSGYTGMPPYDIGYDPTIWQLSVDTHGNNLLVHQASPRCEINLSWAPFHAYALAPIQLAGYKWSLSYFPMGDVDALSYSLQWERGNYMFSLVLPDPLPEIYDPDDKSQCQRDAETVLDTLTIVGISETATSIPMDSATPPRSHNADLPTVTPTPESE